MRDVFVEVKFWSQTYLNTSSAQAKLAAQVTRFLDESTQQYSLLEFVNTKSSPNAQTPAQISDMLAARGVDVSRLAIRTVTNVSDLPPSAIQVGP